MIGNTNEKLESLKKQYEGARINEEHSKWTMKDTSLYGRIFNRSLLIRESDLKDKYHEEARQAALQIKTLVGLEQYAQILHYINTDVEQYMEKRKSEHTKTSAKPNPVKNPVLAAVLSAVVPGLGPLYNGQLLWAIFWFIITPGVWIGTGGLLGWLCHVLAAYQAYKHALRYPHP